MKIRHQAKCTCQHGSGRSKIQFFIPYDIIKRTHTKPVASKPEIACLPVKQGKSKRSVEPAERIPSPTGKGIHHHFGISLRPERKPGSFEGVAQFRVIVDFAVIADTVAPQ